MGGAEHAENMIGYILRISLKMLSELSAPGAD